jgi:hypothetical protein
MLLNGIFFLCPIKVKFITTERKNDITTAVIHCFHLTSFLVIIDDATKLHGS